MILSLRTLFSLLSRRLPGQLVIQMTDNCNASCPQCGMRRSAHFSRSRLPVESIIDILDACTEKGVEAVSFTGGEPLMYFDDLITCLKHASNCGIKYTRTGTNGFMFMHSDRKDFETRMHRMAERLVSSGIYTFWISLDSAVPDVHESMRGLPGVVRGIEKAIPIFAGHGLYPSANLGINRNIAGWHPEPCNPGKSALINDGDERHSEDKTRHSATYRHYRNAFRMFYHRAINMGFTIVNACYPMSDSADTSSIDPVYRAFSADTIVSFTRSEKIDVFQALFDTIPEYRNAIRIFTPRSSLLHLIRHYSNSAGSNKSGACRGGIDYFYIDAATGHAYPCGYRGNEDLGDFRAIRRSSLPRTAFCTRCDWECFRDPSVMFDPVLMLVQNPFRLLHKAVQDTRFRKTWLEDILYYRNCHFFNGQKAW